MREELEKVYTFLEKCVPWNQLVHVYANMCTVTVKERRERKKKSEARNSIGLRRKREEKETGKTKSRRLLPSSTISISLPSFLLFPHEFLSDSLLHPSSLFRLWIQQIELSGISDSTKHIHNDTSHNSYVSPRCGRTTYAIRIISRRFILESWFIVVDYSYFSDTDMSCFDYALIMPRSNVRMREKEEKFRNLIRIWKKKIRVETHKLNP